MAENDNLPDFNFFEMLPDFLTDETLDMVGDINDTLQTIEENSKLTAQQVVFDELDEPSSRPKKQSEKLEERLSVQLPTVLNDEHLTKFVEENKSKNTKYKNVSDYNVWIRWCEKITETRKLEDIPPEELNKLLSHFWLNIKKKNGEEYEPDSLTSFQRTLDRILRERGRQYSLLKDKVFESSRQLLASKRKQLRQIGKGGKPNRAEPLTDAELDQLWETKQLGGDSPLALLKTNWMNNTMHFGMRARHEHHKLRYGDLVLKEDETGEYVMWQIERGTKTRTGENENVPDRLFSPRMYATGTERCPVKYFKLFKLHRPEEMSKPDDPFYLQAIVNPTTTVWFKKQRLGLCSLSNFMKSMAEVCNITGKKTNHSARKTMITVLRNNEVAPIQVAQLSGHRNLKSLDSYWSASTSQQKKMSNLISQATDEKAKVPAQDKSLNQFGTHSTMAPIVPVSTAIQLAPALQGMFANANISHSSIQIFTNYPGSISMEPTPTRCYKRVRPLDSDDDN